MNTQEQPATMTTEQKPKRNAATKLWVHYEHEGQKGLVGFDFKTDLDTWLQQTNATVLKIVRGVEKKFAAQNRVTLT